MNEPRDEDLAADASGVEEIVDGVPVPDGPVAVPTPAPAAGRQSMLPGSPVAAQAVAVAVGSFAAGAVTLAVVRKRRTRKAAKRSRRARKELGAVLGSRSFLVDVHLLGGGRD